LPPLSTLDLPQADAVVAAVAHDDYKALTMAQLAGKLRPGGCVVDVKGALDREAVAAAGFSYWRV
jgi:UDP-N-acetyl-D-galactosamine dehydrogenase